MKRKRAALTTLGCRLNQSETHVLTDKLHKAGFDIVAWGAAADLAIINTCTVTRLADAKCRQVIRKFIRENPEAFVAVVGCYSQMGAREIAAIPGVDLIVGNQDKLSVLDHIGDGARNERTVIIRERIDRRDFSLRWAGETPFNQRANLKIQDGCNFMCSFCVIPFARGRARSRDWADLMLEARSQAKRGVRELVLTGVNLGTYDGGGRTIVDVCDALAELDGIQRIRISSIEPTTVPMDLFDRMADPAHALQPFLHLPLQSGCDRILANMRRRYRIAEWEAFVGDARARVPGLYVGTDVMVAFPGETEDDFEETTSTLIRNRIAFAHVFTYSERVHTQAARLEELMIPVKERQRRSARLRSLSERLRYDWMAQHLGQTVEVLFENSRDGLATGLTANFIRVCISPEKFGNFPGTADDLANTIGEVRLDRIAADFTEGVLTRTFSVSQQRPIDC